MKIAFLRPKSWPLANVKVAEALAEQFAECDLQIVDLQSLIKKHIGIILINTLVMSWIYGREILSKHKKIKEAFWRTPFIYHAIKRLLTKRLVGTDYLFTFQMQSLFDGSQPGIPHFVYTDHTHLANLNYPDFDRRKLYPQKWIDLEKEIYENASLTFVRSSNIRQSLIEQYGYPKEKVLCVYAGSNIEVEIAYTAGKKYDEQKILFVGIDWKRKGGPDLVDAFRIVREKYPNATLTIVGANPQINVPNSEIVGKVSPQKLKKYYETATLFCMPTYVEPFGIAFLEAMQARLPIIGTKIGAVPDIVQHGWNGWLVEPGDVQGIADAIMNLFNNPDLCRQFGERNFALTQERYSWKAVGKKFRTHILEILSNPAAK